MLRIALKCRAKTHTQSSQRLSQGARGKGKGEMNAWMKGQGISISLPLTPMFLMPVAGATYRAGPSRVVPASLFPGGNRRGGLTGWVEEIPPNFSFA